MKLLLRLYPGWWRRRYGAEALDILKKRPLTVLLGWDLVVGALDAWLNQRMPPSAFDENDLLQRVRNFAPLDPDERLPGESLRGSRLGLQFYRVDVDQRRLSRREVAVVVVIPAMFLLLGVLAWVNATPAAAVGAIVLLLLGLVALAFSGRRPRHRPPQL